MRDNGNGISAQTSNFYLQAIKQFARWMVRDGRASESPLDHLTGVNAKLDRRHLSAVSASDEGRNSKITPAAKKPANPVKQRETQAVRSGEGGIRTPGTREGTPVFETGTFGHSVTSPKTPKRRKQRGFGREYKQSCNLREGYGSAIRD